MYNASSHRHVYQPKVRRHLSRSHVPERQGQAGHRLLEEDWALTMLGKPPTHDGVDSLMAIELRNMSTLLHT
jgi:hypothetical protein